MWDESNRQEAALAAERCVLALQPLHRRLGESVSSLQLDVLATPHIVSELAQLFPNTTCLTFPAFLRTTLNKVA